MAILKTMEDEKEKLKTSNADLNAEMEIVRANATTLSQEKDDLNTALEVTNRMLKNETDLRISIQEEKEKAKEDLEKLNADFSAEVESFRAYNDALRGERDDLTTALEGQKSHVVQLQQRVADLEQINGELQGEVEDLKQAKETTEVVLAAKEDELAALMARQDEQEKELDEARSESALMEEVSANIVNQLLRIKNKVSTKRGDDTLDFFFSPSPTSSTIFFYHDFCRRLFFRPNLEMKFVKFQYILKM